MELPFNLVLALALAGAAIAVVVAREWLGARVRSYDVLRTVSVALALLLVPPNLVFAFSGQLSVFNAVVMTGSIVGLGVLAMLAHPWRVEQAITDDDPTQSLVIGASGLRVLAVGVDGRALEDAQLEVFSRAGHEVFALVLGDGAPSTVAAAERTIVDAFPEEHLPALGTEVSQAIAEHAHQLQPDLILAPAGGGPTGATIRDAAGRIPQFVPVLYYPGAGHADDAPEPTLLQPLEHTVDWQYRPGAPMEDDDGRVTMPSFAS